MERDDGRLHYLCATARRYLIGASALCRGEPDDGDFRSVSPAIAVAAFLAGLAFSACHCWVCLLRLTPAPRLIDAIDGTNAVARADRGRGSGCARQRLTF